MSEARPLADFRSLVAQMPAPDDAARDAVSVLFRGQEAGASRLADLAATVVGTTGSRPAILRPSLSLFAGTHGIARHGLSNRRLDATLELLSACGSGDAPVSHLCAANMIGLKVYDLALHMPTGDISQTDAMDERNGAATIAFGMEAIAGADCVLLGSIGSAGDETVAAALLCALHGGKPGDWLPDDEFRSRRMPLVEQALARQSADDPLAMLVALGGREFAAIAGAIVAARTERIPVILEGLTALAAASALAAMNETALHHCVLADAAAGATQRAADLLGLVPVLAPDFPAGEGTAAALAVSIMRDALAMQAGLAAHSRAQRPH